LVAGSSAKTTLDTRVVATIANKKVLIGFLSKKGLGNQNTLAQLRG
jgi:hypothetical protein